MITTLSGYLTRLFLGRFALFLFGLTAVILLLDLLTSSDEVIKRADSIVGALGRYAVLRLPDVLSQILPLSVLLGALATFAGLARHSELPALFAAGLSRFRLIGALLPVALLIAVVQFVIENHVLPQSNRALRAWGVGEFEDFSAVDQSGRAWIVQGSDFLRFAQFDPAQKTLRDVTIFRRNETGHLIERIEAVEAELGLEVWTLKDVTRIGAAGAQPITLPTLDWPASVTGEKLRLLAVHPRELTWDELATVTAQAGLGNHPPYLYDVWRQKKLARPPATLLLILLAVAVVQQIHPRRQAGLMLSLGIAAGFVYWIFDELVVSLGESGLLPAVISAWAAPLVLGAVTVTFVLRHDGN